MPITTKRRYRGIPVLKKWLDERGLSQGELAEILGLSQAQVSRYLSGERSLPIAVALELSNLTGIAAERLSNRPATTRLLKLLGDRNKSPSSLLNNSFRDA